MEDLNKQQLVMVALLVSFITSIATGIVTVSLVNQAPQKITQTIDRVIEKTVEKVVPSNNQATVMTKETLVVSQDKMASDAVQKNTKSLVRISGVPISGGVVLSGNAKFLGIGIILDSEGTIVGDKGILSGGTHYVGTFSDGKTAVLQVIAADNENDIIIFKTVKQSTDTEKREFFPAIVGDTDELFLGQTVISLYGELRNRVSLGIVSSLIEYPKNEKLPEEDNSKKVYAIETDLSSRDIALGSFLLDLSGKVLGIKTSTLAGDRDTYLSMNVIKSKVPSLVISN